MTTTVMTMKEEEDEEFQASSEDIEIKPWDLPYWHGGPKKDKKQAAQEALDAEEEVEVVEPLTVEELEAIRNEGYEEGFLQGLNEGREKGEKEGLITGKAEGYKEGHEAGVKEGNRIGFEAGQSEGLASGKQEITDAARHLADLSLQLEQSLVEKDSALPKVLSQLIRTACETIIERELAQGDEQITKKVLSALERLPGGADNIKIFVSPQDEPYLKQGLTHSGRDMNFSIDDALVAGSARITTAQSLIEFSQRERMDAVFELIDQECEKLDLSDIEGEPFVKETAVAEETDVAEKAEDSIIEEAVEEVDEAVEDSVIENEAEEQKNEEPAEKNEPEEDDLT